MNVQPELQPKVLPQPFPFWILPSNKQWESVLHLAERREYAPQQHIVRSNVVSQEFFYLRQGKVRCEQTGLNGNIKVCYYVKSGSLFGEGIAISAIPSYAALLAVDACVVYAFSLKLLYAVIAREHPDLMLNMMELMAYKIRMYSLHLYSTTLNDIESQVCRILYQLLTYENRGREWADNFTQQDIADVLGVHRNTIVRALRRLKEEGILIRFTKKHLEVSSLEELLQRSMNPVARNR